MSFSTMLRTSRLVRPSLARWVCPSCSPPVSRRWKTDVVTDAVKKPFFVTTPIFYVNAAAHLGHLYSMLLADAIKRHRVLNGDKAIMLTGTDEHGMKIQQAAEKANKSPSLFCDENAANFEFLAQKADVDNDIFMRTTSPEHKNAVQHFWTLLEANGMIYSAKHEGWYCVSDETFYPESGVKSSLDPLTGKKIMVSIETGREVEWSTETNYHFKLSTMRDRLLQFYKENPNFVTPKHQMDAVVSQVEAGLSDLSISRPVERLSWGISVPGDESQTIYVWLDALINYIAAIGFPWTPGKMEEHGWPADVQIVGKDIVRFHAIYWPAFLLAVDIPPPKKLLVHSHWTMSKRKMSKTEGNVVNPFFAFDRFGVDPLRYYMIKDGGIDKDADYDNFYVARRYKKDLRGSIGNLTSRLLRSEKWNIAEAVEQFAKRGDDIPYDNTDLFLRHRIKDSLENVNEHMLALRPNSALRLIAENFGLINGYFSKKEPWTLDKDSSDPSVVERLNLTIFLALEGLRIQSILLQFVMPSKANEILDLLGVSKHRRTFEYAKYKRDWKYGVPHSRIREKMRKDKNASVFPPLVLDDTHGLGDEKEL